MSVSNQNHILGASNRPGERNASDPPKATIVVLDDDLYFRQGAVRALKQEGYDVFEAIDVEALVDILSRAPVDLVLADSRLTDGNDGWASAKQIVAQYPKTKVLMMSGYSASEIADDGGATFGPHVMKGGDFASLFNEIERTLA
jgi:CheY-like chemotaxis protein